MATKKKTPRQVRAARERKLDRLETVLNMAHSLVVRLENEMRRMQDVTARTRDADGLQTEVERLKERNSSLEYNMLMRTNRIIELEKALTRKMGKRT